MWYFMINKHHPINIFTKESFQIKGVKAPVSNPLPEIKCTRDVWRVVSVSKMFAMNNEVLSLGSQHLQGKNQNSHGVCPSNPITREMETEDCWSLPAS